MTLTLNLPPELEQYLTQEAKQQGLSVETYTLQILPEYILPKEKQSKLDNSKIYSSSTSTNIDFKSR